MRCHVMYARKAASLCCVTTVVGFNTFDQESPTRFCCAGLLLSCRCQPAQLWGVLWGFAQFSYPPEESYMASWLAAAQQQLDGFNAEGLAHSIWALAALGHVPHKLWLRAYCGMVAYKIK